MDIDSMIAVLQAAKEGKVIQCDGGGWRDTPDPMWNFGNTKYRAKPEPVKVELQVGTTTDGKFIYTFENPNLELEFTEGKLTGAKVL